MQNPFINGYSGNFGKAILTLSFLLQITCQVFAGIVFDGSPGTSAPPASLGGFPMTPFAPDTRPADVYGGSLYHYTNVPIGGDCDAEIRFDLDLSHRKIGTGWNTWSHGYTGSVYYTSTVVRAINLPEGTRAFYFYFEGNVSGTYNIQAVANDGTTSGVIPVSSIGGAHYFGFYTTASACQLSTIRIYAPIATNGFAVGEFGIFLDKPNGELVCDDHIQVSLDTNCKATIFPSMILENEDGDGCSYGDYVIELRDWNTGALVDVDPFLPWPQVGLEQVGHKYMVKIIDPASGNSCWGEVLVEKKFPPKVDCPADITLGYSCLDNIPPADICLCVNCERVTMQYYDKINYGSCDLGYDRVITRTFIVSDDFGNTNSCVQSIRIELGNVDEIVPPANYDDLPLHEKSLGCDEKVDRSFDPTLHYTNSPECVDGYILDSTIFLATGNRVPKVMGWNCIDSGPYSGHPSPTTIYYPKHSESSCTIDSAEFVLWLGTGAPIIGVCRNINMTFTDTKIDLARKDCNAGLVGCFKVLREWVAVDWCTNKVRRMNQLIKVMDKKGPEIIYPDTVSVAMLEYECKGRYDLPLPWLADNCSEQVDYSLEIETGEVSGSSSTGYIISNLGYGFHDLFIVAEDCCGNITKKKVVLDVLDVTPPIAVCEKRTVVALNGKLSPGLNTVKIQANTFDDGSFDNCSQHLYFKAIRMDELLGTLNGSTKENKLTCNGANGDDDAKTKDNQVYFDDHVMFCCSDVGNTVMVVFRVFDVSVKAGPVHPSDMNAGGYLAGHFSDCMIEVEVQDKSIPTVVAPPDIVVSCDFWFDIDKLENPYDSTFGKVVNDVAWRSIVKTKDIVCKYSCVGNPKTGYPGYISGIPTHLEPASNKACNYYNSLFDINHPESKYDLLWGQDGYVLSSCGAMPQIEVEDRRDCGSGRILRHFFVRTPNNVVVKATQTIWVINCDPFTVDPDFCSETDDIDFPHCDQEPIYLEGCGADISPDNPLLGRPQVSNGSSSSCSLISIDYIDERFDIEPDACYKIIRKWEIIDWCQYDPLDDQPTGRWSYYQIIKVSDRIAPIVNCHIGDCEPASKNAQGTCIGHLSISATATDSCTAEDWLFYEYKLDLNNDGRFEYVVGPLTKKQYNEGYLAKNHFNPYADNDNNPFDASGNYPIGKHRIQFYVEDGCGNISKCDTVFTVKDCKAPTPYCLAGVTTVTMPSSGCIDIWAKDLDRGSFDNCTPQNKLKFYFQADTGKPFIRICCEDFVKSKVSDVYVLETEIYVADEEGNFDFCKSFINIQDNGLCPDPILDNVKINGVIKTVNQKEVHPVTVKLYENTALFKQSSVNEKGEYSFERLPFHNQYYLEAIRDDNPVNGVTTADIVKLQKHLLGQEELTDPYLLIAADVTNSKSITAADLAEIRRLILGLSSTFQKVPSWTFVPKDYRFLDPSIPWNYPSQNLVKIVNDQAIIDFVGIKMGDLNLSAKSNFKDDNETRSTSGISLLAQNQEFNSGETVKIILSSNMKMIISGIQFGLRIEENLGEFVGIEENGRMLSSEYYSKISNQIQFSYNWSSPKNIVENKEMISLIVKTKSKGKVSQLFEFNDSNIKREIVYNDESIANDFQLKFMNNGNELNNQQISIIKTEPNPMSSQSNIYLTSNYDGICSVTVYNCLGSKIINQKVNIQKGINTILLDRKDLGISGVYFVQVESTHNKVSQKIIVSD